MSITDELREAAAELEVRHTHNDHDFTDLYYPHPSRREFLAIADRIDIAHKHAIGYVDDRDPETMAENGWVRLPKDADGEYIHIGDVMAYADNTRPAEVVALVPPAVFLTEDGPRYADMCRHYHAPTVEDVLAEFFEQVGDGLHTLEAMDTQLIIAKYAAKLRLADDGEGQ